MKKFFVLAFIVVLGYLYSSPYIALRSIKNALDAGDSSKVSSYIDYPSIRESFKQQFDQRLSQELAKNSTKNQQFAQFGNQFKTLIIETAVDRIVTPEGMTLLLKGNDIKDLAQPQSSGVSNSINTASKTQYRSHYNSLNQFEIQVQRPEENKFVRILMQRDGLSWKISKILIPLDGI